MLPMMAVLVMIAVLMVVSEIGISVSSVCVSTNFAKSVGGRIRIVLGVVVEEYW